MDSAHREPADLSSTDMSPVGPSSDSMRADVAGDAQRESVRGEAARAARRLKVARDRIATAREPGGGGPSGARSGGVGSSGAGSGGVGSGGAAGSDAAWGGFDDVDDDLRSLLAPAVERISRVTDLAEAMAAGELSDESAAEAARAIAADQPHRRPR